MGVVSDYVRDLVRKQVDDKGVVVWFDPDGHYRDFAHALSLPETTIACYEDSFFSLRHQIEPFLNGDEPPRLVIYVPMAEEETHDALVELTCAGVTLRPGQHPWQRNTRLSVVASRALRGIFGDQELATTEKDTEAGKLSLRDLDELAARKHTGVLTLIFDTGDAAAIALKWMSSEQYDAPLMTRDAHTELTQTLGRTYGIELSAEESLQELRMRLARHVFSTEFIASLRGALPPQLATVHVASEGPTRAACVDLARTWRLRRDVAESYSTYATRIEQELGLAGLRFALEQIRECETFAIIEEALQDGVEAAIPAGRLQEALAIAHERQTRYWASCVPEIQARWTLIRIVGQLLAVAERITVELSASPLSATELLRAYTEGPEPWCALDTMQRELEYRLRKFDFGPQHASLEQLIAYARQRYMAVGSTLAEQYMRALADNYYQAPGFPRQTAVYATYVAPALRQGKTAYMLVDALRFEMARELTSTLGDGYMTQLGMALGAVPTITPVGMAALMPGADSSAQVVALGSDKLGLEVAGTLLKDRKNRVDWITSHAGSGPQGTPARVYETTLEALLPPSATVKAKIKGADLVFVTSQEIDQICESDNILLARSALDDILANLQRAIRQLAEMGCKTLVITADHGFIFADELDDAMKLDPPGGETLDLHRRVWVGRGGMADSSFLRAPLTAFDLSSDPTLEIAVPRGFGGFKVRGGARAYFHGGISPQEMAIPVAVVVPAATAPLPGGSDIEWMLTPGAKKITTRFSSVQVTGRSMRLLGVSVPPIRVEIRAGKEVISLPVSASYGYSEATGDVQMAFQEEGGLDLAPNTIALMITREDLPSGSVTIHLLDAITGRELHRLEDISMSITI